ncbi:uncharacterized protein LOC106672840 [Cimex lectularius]|uniref:Uncharacterized protein n=1 Tax=Cimex lectularius TaxID=79782 RepID=A0A8I6S9H9_CIMLE|nr:uncharacterized protein LOC106672840 [Cimex lectularius]
MEKPIKEEPDFHRKNSKFPDDIPEGEVPALSPTEDPEGSAKFRRILQTFVNHARDHSTDRAENVVKLITNLVVGTVNFEEFEKSLYELTKTSPRHYVTTYMKAYTPIFQKEMIQQARNSKTNLIDYVTSQLLEDEGQEIQAKRRRTDRGYDDELPVPNSRPLLVPVHPLASSNPSQANKSNEEQWRNIDVMLNCILSMVEKTIAAIGILQGRTAEDLMAQTIRLTEDRVQQVKKRAEEAVAEVNRKALLELQRAVSAAETRASQLAASDLPRRNSEKACNSGPHNSCWNCGRKAEETCSGCNLAKYCSSFCQHKDWESHHTTCRNKFK